MSQPASEAHDATQTFSLVQQIKSLINLVEAHRVCDVVVQARFAIHVFLHEPGHVAAALVATEGRASPHSSGNELEGPRRDFRSAGGNTDNNALAPTFVAALERTAH